MRPTRATALRTAAAVVSFLSIAGLASSAQGDAGKGHLARTSAGTACSGGAPSAGYAHRVERALRARRDLWGDRLLAARGGPTYDAVRRYLPPLLLARAARGRSLTDSGVHYLPFTQPESTRGAISVALHVADGSQVISERAHGRTLTISVGHRGEERFGSCLLRLSQPRLVEGWLPILDTRYVDASGVRYRQESFAARIPGLRSLVSLVRLTADATHSQDDLTRLRLTPSVPGLSSDGSRLTRSGRTYLVYSDGGSFTGKSVKYAVPRGTVQTVYAAWFVTPSSSKGLIADDLTYESAKESLTDFWGHQLAHGGTIDVPEERVADAERSLLVQDLGLTWRYSIGNQYEQLSYPEAVDVARVIDEFGHAEVGRAILWTLLAKKQASPLKRRTEDPDWKMGARLLGVASYAGVTQDRAFVLRATPILRRYVRALGRQIRSSKLGLLRRERYSSDVPDAVYGLHSQAVVWQGLRAMGDTWAAVGDTALASECRQLASRLRTGLRRAIRASQDRLPDGSLFVPVRLLDHVKPYRSLTASRDGSYWNLVAPYALASGIITPRSPQADGVLEYMLRHGSRLLGLVRAGAYALYGDRRYPTSGSDQVYGLNVARFLADEDEPGQLVLSLYGQLAAAMTPGTFVAGESASIAPLPGSPGRFRTMYLPPNSASNAAFLETLRLMLVHETADGAGRPRGLELAFATPPAWLQPGGGGFSVRGLSTSFGKVSFRVEPSVGVVNVQLDLPDRVPVRSLRLRLRLPHGIRLGDVYYDGLPLDRVDPGTGTIELPPGGGEHELEAETS